MCVLTSTQVIVNAYSWTYIYIYTYVCGIPVPKEVVFANSFVKMRMQGAAGLSSELRPTKTSDGKCENVPAEYTQNLF